MKAYDLKGNTAAAYQRLHELGCFGEGDSLLVYGSGGGYGAEHIAPVSWRPEEAHSTSNVDIEGVIEGTLHQILDAGGTDDDVRLILGLEKDEELDGGEEDIPINMGYSLEGPMWSADVYDKVVLFGLPLDPASRIVRDGDGSLLVHDQAGEVVHVPDEWDEEVERQVGIQAAWYETDGSPYLSLVTLDADGRPQDEYDDLTVNVSDLYSQGTFFRLDSQMQRDALSSLEQAGLAQGIDQLPYGRHLTLTQVSIGADGPREL